ncbi:hypothetical protein [Cytobacillus praedii]|uniref:Uncharacterized protein n=1 Tax=Cytobacillus praedii TaxID=1742358 RepID=A0A4V2NU07_9BACI|nr:hypothetical protein [Cytobacillus praedii]TCJ02440.1 hypothetical protein E0Y62_19600 [Cytobacillus praedii]
MENLLLATLSLVILVPIIYFLPLGLSSKGKIVVTFVSFFLAIIGLLAQLSFPLWQTSLVLLVLVFLSSIVIDSRLRKIIYPLSEKKNVHSHDEITQDLIESEKGLDNEVPALQNANVVSSSKPLNLDKIIASPSDMKIDDDREEVFVDEFTPKAEMEFLEKQLSFEKDNRSEEINLLENSGEEIEEDISFLHNREALLEESLNDDHYHYQKKEDVLGYMSEIERMIAESDNLEQFENYLDYQLEEVAATKEVNNDNSNKTSLYDDDDIPLLKLGKLEPKTPNTDTDEEDEPIIWEDDIEPLKEFKITNSNQGG